ncbi:MAG: hypothetical protein QG622_2188 [Actinomycetota bacterium]|nr:hypothetical protein [Actinomycetota bacterium]
MEDLPTDITRRPRRWATERGSAAVARLVLAGQVLQRAVHRRAARHGDAGDVPGWVLVTLMTAGLVSALWWLAKDRLLEVFERAITSVAG